MRLPNNVYRIREHLTEAEVGKLLAALKSNRHGHRDHMIGLVITGMVCVYQKHATGAGMTLICASAPSSSAGSRAAPTRRTTWSEMKSTGSGSYGASKRPRASSLRTSLSTNADVAPQARLRSRPEAGQQRKAMRLFRLRASKTRAGPASERPICRRVSRLWSKRTFFAYALEASLT